MVKQWNVGMLVFEQVDAFDYVGPSEILSVARYNAQDVKKMLLGNEEEGRKPFKIYTISENGELVTASNGLRIIPDYSIDNAPLFDILLIPGGFLPVMSRVMKNKMLIHWISAELNQGWVDY